VQRPTALAIAGLPLIVNRIVIRVLALLDDATRANARRQCGQVNRLKFDLDEFDDENAQGFATG